MFRLTEWLEYESFPDYSIYDITYEGVTIPFQINIVDVSAHCGSRSSINLAEFIWEYVPVFAVKMYSVICVPPNTPTVLYINHHRAARDGWTSDTLCDECLEEFRLLLNPFVGNCTYLHVSGVNHTHHQEYTKLQLQPPLLVKIYVQLLPSNVTKLAWTF